MGNLLYIIAVILIIGWAIGFIGYSVGGLIHILLVIAVIAIQSNSRERTNATSLYSKHTLINSIPYHGLKKSIICHTWWCGTYHGNWNPINSLQRLIQTKENCRKSPGLCRHCRRDNKRLGYQC